MNQWKPIQMHLKTASTLKTRLSSKCDVCGKHRGGRNPVSHAKCAKIRAKKSEA